MRTLNERPDHYFTASPSVTSARRVVALDLPAVSAKLVTDRGVFSAERVDPGTKLLLLEAPMPAPSVAVVADVGCGYGPIAVAVATAAPHATVWAVDTNERARALCAENAASLANVRVAAPHEVPAELLCDVIYSNLPIRIGKAALHALVLDWLARLAAGGRAYFVVQKHLGADSLARWIESQSYSVRRIASRAGYRVIEVAR